MFANEAEADAALQLPSEKQWAAMVYMGITHDRNLWQVATFQYRRSDEALVALEVLYGLAHDNPVRMFVSPVVHNIQFASIVGVRQSPRDKKPIFEWNPYFMVRWDRFFWSKWVLTSFAVGEGFSLTTEVPALERQGPKTSRFLNYLMFEATLGLPALPDVELVGRIHHRSGVYGLYGAGDSGSNNVGLGLRLKLF